MLKKEFKYYLDNQDELVKEYNGKVIVIVGEKVIKSYSSKIEAYEDSIKSFESGTFLIIMCSPGSDNYTFTQRSRILATINIPA